MTKADLLEKFLEVDMKTKENMMAASPSENLDFDEEARFKYVESAERTLSDFLKNIKSLFEELGIMGVSDVEQKIKSFQEELYRNGYGKQSDMKSFYKNNFSQMRPDFVEKVKHEIGGYYVKREDAFLSIVKQAKSFNEVLHVIHSYVVNNENILQSVPAISEKKNSENETISLRGKENELAQQIFEKFPIEMSCGSTDIIALKEKIIIMARDRGHALLMEIEQGKEESIVRYFIPKLCNIAMINELKGVRKVKEDVDMFAGVNGVFSAPTTDIATEIFDLINHVPMDKDMILKPYVPMQNSTYEPALFDEQSLAEVANSPERKFTRLNKVLDNVKKMIQKRKDKSKENREDLEK